MSRSNQTMNINLDRKTVIVRLLAKRRVIEQEFLDVYKEESEYATTVDTYRNAVLNAVLNSLANHDGEIKDVDVYSDTVVLRFDARVNVERPSRRNSQKYSSDYYKNQMDQIDQTISLLEMCTDDTIKSKQYGNIIGLLF